MSTNNIQTVQAIYEAFGRGDVAAIVDLCTDDVDWAAEAETKSAAWHGAHRGKAELPDFFTGIVHDVDVTEFTPLSIGSNDDGDVFATIRFGFLAKRSGKSAAMNIHHWWRLRDGKVWYYRGSEDTALTAATLGSM